MGPRNQGVTIPNGTTQGNFYLSPTCTITLITSNLVHEIIIFNISYPNVIKFPYFANLIQRGDRG